MKIQNAATNKGNKTDALPKKQTVNLIKVLYLPIQNDMGFTICNYKMNKWIKVHVIQKKKGVLFRDTAQTNFMVINLRRKKNHLECNTFVIFGLFDYWWGSLY